MKIGRRAGGDSVHRQPGAARPDAALEQRPPRQGIPRRSWAAGRSAASSASASKSRIAGRTRCRASRRSGCGSPKAPRTACGRGSRSSPACSTTAAGCRWSSASTTGTTATSATCATRRRWRGSALLYSEQTARYHPGVAPGDRAEDHVLGMYHALVEARVPFELVHEAFLTPDRLDRFKLLILADAAALSDAQCAAIRDYVAARRQPARDVRQLALRRDRPAPRPTSASPMSSACRSAAGIDGPMQNSYLSLETERPAPTALHPMLRRPGRHAAHHQRRVPDRGAPDGSRSRHP